MPNLPPESLASSLAQIHQVIESHCKKVKRERSEVTLIAVSKTHPAEKVVEALGAGQIDFGENYVQELVTKVRVLGEQAKLARWHFIGHLQTNKVKTLIEDVPGLIAIHSVDSEKLLWEIVKRWSDARSHARISKERTLQIFIEVNIDGETSKGGLTQAEALGLALKWSSIPTQDREGLSLSGLMCIPAPNRDPRNQFFSLMSLADQARLKGLSMGMSSDFPIAIEEGATHIRVGTLIFGSRSPTRAGDHDTQDPPSTSDSH